jgi:assimilatory nitrate reductase catalytic subunit
MSADAHTLDSPLPEWLQRRVGPLTSDLVLEPGRFGLGKIPRRLKPDATTSLVCGFCATGCSLTAHLRDGEAINLTATTDYPVNLGMACPKGWEALTPLKASDRATTPWLRNDRTGQLEPCDWERAMVLFCERFKDIQRRHGPESLAWIGTGQITNEELAYLGALAKFGMGIVHGDGNTRQCMATAVTAYKQSFGFDAPPYTYADFEQSDVIVLVGSNLCIAHPILWQRVLRNQQKPEIIVLDPRKTETAMAATQHYALRPKSDLVLLYGLAQMLVTSDAVDHGFVAKHTSGFEEYAKFVAAFTPSAVSEATGLSIEQLSRLAEVIRRGKRVSFWWTMGVNQGHEATRTAQAIINLALMTGNMGRPGTGANSITGQCNAMGSRLFSNTTNLLGGHDFRNAEHRAKISAILQIPERSIPRTDSWAYDQIVEGISTGAIKGLWIIGTNSAHSWIHQNRFKQLAAKLEFLVVQDMFSSTETAQRADLVLPAAGWGEKEGTYVNSERRIGLIKKVARAPGQALSDFNIFRLIAEYWGCQGLFSRWTSPEAVFQLLKECSRGQPCDISGIADYRVLDESGGVQWPYPSEAADPQQVLGRPARERRLFEDGRFFHSDGRARFIFEAPRQLPEPPDGEYPLLLLTGRGSSAQWHTQTRTAKSDVLRKLYPLEPYVEVNTKDAAAMGLVAGQRLAVVSRRGRFEARAFITLTVQPGQVFVPMHYPAANQLTFPVVDPYSRQPGYKACAVRLELPPV